jgi:hypothetical protein
MKSAETSRSGVMLEEDAIVTRWATIPRLRGANALVMHPPHPAHVARGIEDGPRGIVDEDALRRELRTLVKRNMCAGDRGIRVELTKEESLNQLAKTRLFNIFR